MKQKLFLAITLCIISLSVVKAQLKGDPWIFQTYKELYNRQPTAWELNIQNYNLGSWNNYGELKTYVQNYQSSLSNAGFSVSTISLNANRTVALFYQGGKAIAVDLITNDGGSIVASGAGNIVASGAGNVVTNASGNITNLAGVSFGGKYTLQSTGTKVISTSGKGALIIR
jgi:hypothetical protein